MKNNRQQNTISGTIKTVSQDLENQIKNQTSNRNIIISNDSVLIEQNNYNCEIWSPESSTVYLGTVFEQERYCDIDMMQKWNYSSNSLIIDIWEERYTETTGYETQNISGIKDWESTTSIYTAWVDTGVIGNCGNWTPAISNQKIDFGQSTNCDHGQQRTRTDREENPSTGEFNIINVAIEIQNDSRVNDRDIVVSKEMELVEKNNYNCETWSPQSSTVYYNLPLEQQRACDIDKMTKWNYALNSSNISTWEERYTEKTDLELHNIVGTHLENNCKDALAFDPSLNTGIYKLYNSTQNYDAYCDMDTNGGGWTLVMMTREGASYNGSSNDPTVINTVITTPNYDNWTEQPHNSNILDMNTTSNVITEAINKVPFNELLFQCSGSKCLDRTDVESIYEDTTISLFASKNGQLIRKTNTAFPFNTVSMFYVGGDHSNPKVPTDKINFNPQCAPETHRPYSACTQIGIVGFDYYSFQNAVGYGIKGFENYRETNDMNVMLGGMHHRGFNVWDSNVFIR